MTNPFMVQPGPAIQQPGLSDSIAQGVAGVLSAMKQAEDLKRQKEAFEQQQQYYKTQTEGSQLENTQRRLEIQQKKHDLDAQTQGLQAFQTWVGKGAKYEDLGHVVAQIKDPQVAQDFINRATAQMQMQAQAAQARSQAVAANVQEQTQGAQIQREKSQAATAVNQATTTTAQAKFADRQEAAQTALLEAQVENARLQRAKLLQDSAAATLTPEEQNAITTLFKTGSVTIGQAYGAFGKTPPPGVDPNLKFEAVTRGAAIYRATAKSAMANSLVAHEAMQGLLDQGVRIGKFTPLKEAAWFDLLRGSIPEKEKQLLAAAGQFVSQYTLAISGKQSTDAERHQLMRQIAPMTSDGPAILEQKRIMRETMVQIMNDAASGGTRPVSQIIGDAIGGLRGQGVSGDALKFLQNSQRQAMSYELSQRQPVVGDMARPPINAGMDPAQDADSVETMLNAYGN